MDTDLFRIVLLVAGVLLVVGVFAWDRLRVHRREQARRAEPIRPGRRGSKDGFDVLEDDLALIEQVIRAEDEFDISEPRVVGSRRAPRETPAEPPANPQARPPRAPSRPPARPQPAPPDATPPARPQPQPTASSAQPAARPAQAQAPAEPTAAETREQPAAQKIVALTVVARSGTISGIRLRKAFAEQRLGFGPMGIYHRRDDGAAVVQFSVANLVVPGTFDPSTLDGFTSPGLALFLSLPGPAEPLAAFDAMLQSARELATRLDAEVCDTQRRPLDGSGIAALREQARVAPGS